MNAVEHLLARQYDGILYHYTTQKGLLGIVESAEIWATDVQYLNDASEFNLACKCAVWVINQKIKNEKDSKLKTLLGYIAAAASRASINVSVASFSEQGDL